MFPQDKVPNIRANVLKRELSEAIETASRTGILNLDNILHLEDMDVKKSEFLEIVLPFLREHTKNLRLTRVSLRKNNLDDDEVKSIIRILEANQHLNTLLSLDLANNNIRSEGVKAITKTFVRHTKLTPTILESLNLSGNDLNDDDLILLIKELENNPTLSELTLNDNLLTESTATELAKILKTNTKLNILRLTHNPLGSNGIITLTEALKRNPVLDTLDLDNINIDITAAQALWNALEYNVRLTTLQIDLLNTDKIETLAEETKEENEDEEKNKSEADMRNKKNQYASIRRKIFQKLRENTERRNALFQNTFTKSLETNTLDLKHLSLTNTEYHKIYNFLKKNNTIMTINLGDNNTNQKIARIIEKILTSKTYPNTTLSSLGTHFEEQYPKIKSLLAANRAQRESSLTEILDKARTTGSLDLKDFGLTKIEFEERVMIFLQNPNNTQNLKECDFSGNKLNTPEIMVIAKALENNKTLTTLGDSTLDQTQAIQTLLFHNVSVKRSLDALNEALNRALETGNLYLHGIDLRLHVETHLIPFLENNPLSSINFQHTNLEDAQIIDIINALHLQENKILSSLEMPNMRIDDKTAEIMATALHTNSTLTTLNLSANNISNEGAKQFAEALQLNNTLTFFDFSNNRINNVGLMEIKNALEKNTSLISIGYLEYYNPNRGYHSKWSDNQNLIQIHYLLENNNQIQQSMATVPKTNLLTITQTLSPEIRKKTIKDVASLLANNMLTSLEFRSSLDDDDVIEIAAALKQNTSLRFLNLSSNRIGNRGAIALAEILRENITLTCLKLNYNEEMEDGQEVLIAALKENSTLTELYCQIDHWSKPNNYALHNYNTIHIKQAIQNALATGHLILKDMYLTADFEKLLTPFLSDPENTNKLTSIDFSGTVLNDEQIQLIANLLRENNSLTEIELYCTGLNDHKIALLAESLKKNNTLTKLNIYRKKEEYTSSPTHLSSQGENLLAEALKTNTTLFSLGETVRMPSNIKQHLERNYFKFQNPHCLDKALLEARETGILDLNNKITKHEFQQQILPFIQQNDLIHLNLSNNDFGNDEAKMLGDILKNSTSLKSINLQGTHIDAQGLKMITEALQSNSSLHTLNIDNIITPREIQILQLTLMARETGILNLESMGLTEIELAKYVMPLLIDHFGNLTSINLMNNPIGNNGLALITHILERKNKITTLNLNNTQIDDDGAMMITNILKNNNMLVTLHLEKNNIGSKGIEAFKQFLQSNKTLTTLYGFRNNDIRYLLGSNYAHTTGKVSFSGANLSKQLLDEQVMPFLDTHQYIITELDLGETGISFVTLKMLLSPRIIQNLRILNLSNHNITLDEVKILAKIFTNNTQLISLPGLDHYPEIERLLIRNRNMKNIPDILKTGQVTGILNFSNMHLTTQDLEKYIIPFLQNPENIITQLDLSGNHLDSKAADMLATLLKPQAAKTIKDVFGLKKTTSSKLSKTLICLNLEKNQIGHKGFLSLIDSLQTNNTLKTLYINHNQISNLTNAEMVSIAHILTANKSITSLGTRFEDLYPQFHILLKNNSQPAKRKILTEVFTNESNKVSTIIPKSIEDLIAEYGDFSENKSDTQSKKLEALERAAQEKTLILADPMSTSEHVIFHMSNPTTKQQTHFALPETKEANESRVDPADRIVTFIQALTPQIIRLNEQGILNLDHILEDIYTEIHEKIKLIRIEAEAQSSISDDQEANLKKIKSAIYAFKTNLNPDSDETPPITLEKIAEKMESECAFILKRTPDSSTKAKYL